MDLLDEAVVHSNVTSLLHLTNYVSYEGKIFFKNFPSEGKFSKIFPERPLAHAGRFCTSGVT